MPSSLVTGGAGFIGCAVSAELARQFDQVIAIFEKQLETVAM